LAVALELPFQIRDSRLAGSQFRAIRGEFFQEHVDVIAGLDEGAFAHPCGEIPVLFAELKRPRVLGGFAP
jgi:hypothetical protein